MSELFDIEESLSPRLAWMREHGISVEDGGPSFHPGDECELTGKTIYRYQASSPAFPVPLGGDTEMEAIEMMAAALNLKLWNEK